MKPRDVSEQVLLEPSDVPIARFARQGSPKHFPLSGVLTPDHRLLVRADVRARGCASRLFTLFEKVLV